LRFKSKTVGAGGGGGGGNSSSHKKRSNSFSDDDEYEVEYPRKKQRTSPVASPRESVVAIPTSRWKVKNEENANGHTNNSKNSEDFQADHKTYTQQLQRPMYQTQQYADAQPVPLAPSYYAGGNEYTFFRPAFGVMYYQPQADGYSNTHNGYQHHAYNTPSTLNHYNNGHTPHTNGNRYNNPTSGVTRSPQSATNMQYENLVKAHMPEFHSTPNVTAHSNQYFTNITSLNNPVPINGSATANYPQQPTYNEYTPNQSNSTIDIYNLN